MRGRQHAVSSIWPAALGPGRSARLPGVGRRLSALLSVPAPGLAPGRQANDKHAPSCVRGATDHRDQYGAQASFGDQGGRLGSPPRPPLHGSSPWRFPMFSATIRRSLPLAPRYPDPTTLCRRPCRAREVPHRRTERRGVASLRRRRRRPRSPTIRSLIGQSSISSCEARKGSLQSAAALRVPAFEDRTDCAQRSDRGGSLVRSG